MLERGDVEAFGHDEGGVEREVGIFELEAGLGNQKRTNQVELVASEGPTRTGTAPMPGCNPVRIFLGIWTCP